MAQLHELAAECVDAIISDASGSKYAPCFRDCLSDNRDTAEARIVEIIARALKEAGKS